MWGSIQRCGPHAGWGLDKLVLEPSSYWGSRLRWLELMAPAHTTSCGGHAFANNLLKQSSSMETWKPVLDCVVPWAPRLSVSLIWLCTMMAIFKIEVKSTWNMAIILLIPGGCIPGSPVRPKTLGITKCSDLSPHTIDPEPCWGEGVPTLHNQESSHDFWFCCHGFNQPHRSVMWIDPCLELKGTKVLLPWSCLFRILIWSCLLRNKRLRAFDPPTSCPKRFRWKNLV